MILIFGQHMLQALGGNLSAPTCGESTARIELDTRAADSAVQNYNKGPNLTTMQWPVREVMKRFIWMAINNL